MTTFFNLETAPTDEMLEIALAVRLTRSPVPERREERTTEGGLDIAANKKAV